MINNISIGKRQYVFCSNIENRFNYKNVYEIEGKLLYVGEDCHVQIIKSKAKSIVLVGEIYDPANPYKESKEILEDINKHTDSIDDLCKYCDVYVGRWSLIIYIDRTWYVFNDACGFSQVFYCTSISNGIIASQYELIALLNGFIPNEDALEYIRLAKDKSEEYCWILDCTLYSNIKRLLPNHCLNLSQLKTYRFWPLSGNKQQNYNKAIRDTANILMNGILAATERHGAWVSLTAGLDTRMLLAGSIKTEKNKRHLFTHVNYKAKRGILDLSIAKEICKGQEESHTTIEYSDEKDLEYKDYLIDTHSLWHTIDYKLSTNMSAGEILVKGSCAEVARNSFGNIPNKYINSKILAELHGIPMTKWSLSIIKYWLDDIRIFADEFKFNILDLFYWEHRMGCWQAMCQNESDYYFDTFTPFNCRELLTIWLGIDEKNRIPDKYKVFMDIIKIMDSTVLNYPINPQYKKITFKVKRILKFKFPRIYIKFLQLKSRR